MSNVRRTVTSKAKQKGKGQVFELEDEESDGEVEIVSGMSSVIQLLLHLLKSTPQHLSQENEARTRY